jgi:hypothetical protein
VRAFVQHLINGFDDSLHAAVSSSTIKPFCGKSNGQLRANPDDKEFRVIFGSNFLSDLDLELVATFCQRTLHFLNIVGMKSVTIDNDTELTRFALRSFQHRKIVPLNGKRVPCYPVRSHLRQWGTH